MGNKKKESLTISLYEIHDKYVFHGDYACDGNDILRDLFHEKCEVNIKVDKKHVGKIKLILCDDGIYRLSCDYKPILPIIKETIRDIISFFLCYSNYIWMNEFYFLLGQTEFKDLMSESENLFIIEGYKNVLDFRIVSPSVKCYQQFIETIGKSIKQIDNSFYNSFEISFLNSNPIEITFVNNGNKIIDTISFNPSNGGIGPLETLTFRDGLIYLNDNEKPMGECSETISNISTIVKIRNIK